MAKPFGLGRGLASLIPGADEAPAGGASSNGMAEIAVNEIRTNPLQPRLSRGVEAMKLEELAASIREHGAWLKAHGGLQAKAEGRARLRFGSLLAEEAARQARARAGKDKEEELIAAIARRAMDPYAAVAEMLASRTGA